MTSTSMFRGFTTRRSYAGLGMGHHRSSHRNPRVRGADRVSTDQGGGASRSTDPAFGSSSATDVSLREFIEQRIRDLEAHLNERREGDRLAVSVAKDTADAVLEAHNQLIRQMRDQATESRRQLDKLTDTYPTKENLSTLEMLLGQQLASFEERLTVLSGERTVYVTAESVDAQLQSTRHQIEAVERWQYKLMGALVVATFVVPVVTGTVVYLLTKGVSG